MLVVLSSCWCDWRMVAYLQTVSVCWKCLPSSKQFLAAPLAVELWNKPSGTSVISLLFSSTVLGWAFHSNTERWKRRAESEAFFRFSSCARQQKKTRKCWKTQQQAQQRPFENYCVGFLQRSKAFAVIFQRTGPVRTWGSKRFWVHETFCPFCT